MGEKELVYFIGAEGGPIKIGKATDVKKRLSSHQTSNPEALRVYGVMRGDESAIHQKFEHLRLRGEWFRREPELLAFISGNRDASLWPDPAPIVKIVLVDPDRHGRGPVQVIDEYSDHYGKYGFWDDDETELVDLCAYCKGAEKRGLDPDYECDECFFVTYAIVYFGKWEDGWDYIHYEDLRLLDEEIEADKCREVVERLFPALEAKQINRIVETGDPMTPIYDAQMWKREVEEVLAKNFKIPEGPSNG